MLAALSITATLAARSSRSVVGDTQSDEEACSAACACSGILFGFQSFGHCPSAASIHSRCAKLVLPSCEPKSRQVESMARIQPHPDQLEVCELPHVRDESLLVVTFLNRPSRLFHSLLEGVAASGARLIVLGYGTDPAKVKDKLMLQAGLKIVAAHAFFVRCKRALPASKVVLFLDGSDTVHLTLSNRALPQPAVQPCAPGPALSGAAAARCGGREPLPRLLRQQAGRQH